MKNKTTSADRNPDALRLFGRPFRATVERDRLMLTVTIQAKNPKDRHGSPKQVAAFVCELAAEMNQRCKDIGLGWFIRPFPEQAQVVLEVCDDDDPMGAFVTLLMEQYALVDESFECPIPVFD